MFESTPLILLLLICIVLILIVIKLSNMDGNYEIRRSRIINADINTVFDKIRDFKSWNDWSPWLMHEPDCKLDFSDHYMDEGGYYQWDGEYTGAGQLKHLSLQRPHRIKQELKFIRPFKSTCKVVFELKRNEQKTEITWIMLGTLPFLFRYMKKKMQYMIGQDYSLGLALLAGQLDPDAEYPRIKFIGETQLEPKNSLCKSFSGNIMEMEDAMQAGFPELMDYLKNSNNVITGTPFSVYHKVNIEKMYFVCDMAIPISGNIEPGPYKIKTISGGKYFKTSLNGSYEFLEGAWYAAYAHLHMLKIKYDKSRPSIEVYENDPDQVTTSNDLLTSIYVPLK